jgi:hypothetical protein
MNNSPLANSLSVSVRVYSVLLVAYPKKFREHYETQMLQVFRDSLRDEYHRNKIFGVIGLWLHTFADLLVTALIERIMERSQYMYSPKVILWGGVASICCGLFWILAGVAPISGAGPLVLALLLGLGGLVGLYTRQAGQDGRLGLAGFALAIIGTGLALAALWGSSSTSINLKIDPVSSAPTVLLLALGLAASGAGLTLLGVTGLRAKNLHIWRWLPLGLGLLGIIQGMTFWLFYYLPLSQGQNPWNPWSFGVYVLYPAVHVLLGISWMALGVMLAAEADTKIAQPPPASA